MDSFIQKLSILEKMFYEARPFLYALIATYALSHHENTTFFYSGLILAFCSVIVAGLRVHHRSVALARIKD